MEITEYIEQALEAAIGFARTSERLRASMEAFRPAVQGLQDLQEAEPALGPEIVAATEGVEATLEALSRAMVYLDARYEETQLRLKRAVDES